MATFHSFDKDGNQAIEYKELHKLLIRSVQSHPRLEPLKTRAENSIATRKKTVTKKDANPLGAGALMLLGVNGDQSLIMSGATIRDSRSAADWPRCPSSVTPCPG